MYDFDPKEQLRKKAEQLNELLVRYQHELSSEEKENIMKIISDAYKDIISNRGFDALDYDVRKDNIMDCHAKLDSAFSKFKGFDERGKEENQEIIDK